VTPLTEYAEAVALGGPGAVLADDAVLALHDLAQVNPRRIRVAVPHPLPAGVELPATVEVLHRSWPPPTSPRWRASDEATARDLRAEFAPPTGTLEELMDELEDSRHPWTMLRSAGWLSLTELAARRGEEDVAAIGAWVYARRRKRALIALDPPGLRSMVVPAFQLTAAGDPRPELRPLFAVLLGATGLDGWSVWSWMTSANGDLAGDSPERVAGADPERVLRVATGFAAAAGSPDDHHRDSHPRAGARRSHRMPGPHTLPSCGNRGRAAVSSRLPPARSCRLAVVTITASSRPRVSTSRCRLRPATFLPAS
jgi:hypothetical protein